MSQLASGMPRSGDTEGTANAQAQQSRISIIRSHVRFMCRQSRYIRIESPNDVQELWSLTGDLKAGTV